MTRLHIKLFRYFLTAGAAAIVDVGGFAILCLTPIPIAVSASGHYAGIRVVLRDCGGRPGGKCLDDSGR